MPILAGLKAGDMEPRTIFDKILAKEIPLRPSAATTSCATLQDIAPQAPVHVLLIPKERAGLTQIRNAKEDHAGLLGHMMVVAGSLGNKLCPDGFRLVINDGKQGAQSVYHLHIHICERPPARMAARLGCHHSTASPDLGSRLAQCL